MPLNVEHLRHDDASWQPVQHKYTMELLLSMSNLIEEDGGPECPHGSGYGIYSGRPSIEHTFTIDYTLPDGRHVKQGDVIRMWRSHKTYRHEQDLTPA